MTTAHALTLVECPRDAMQGIKSFIPTEVKIEYLKQLMSAGFDVLDCGSFVNPESIPQMADTAIVIQAISEIQSETKLLVIVANERGALRAASFPKIQYLGFPFSISETFQRRNTNASCEEAFRRLARIQDIAVASKKEVVAYLSMAFGNPYGDEWTEATVSRWGERIASLGIRTLSLADTIGSAHPSQIGSIFQHMQEQLPIVTVGIHLHSKPTEWMEKIESAYNAGCRRFDAALGGFGGCPMAKDDLIGNIPSELAFEWLLKHVQNDSHQLFDWQTLKNIAINAYNSGN